MQASRRSRYRLSMSASEAKRMGNDLRLSEQGGCDLVRSISEREREIEEEE